MTDAVRRRGVDAIWIDTAALGVDHTLELGTGRASPPRLRLPDGRVIELTASTTVWWRRPRVPTRLEDADDDVAAFVDSEWEHTLAAVEPLSECRWVNSPSADRAARNKALQLALAIECGLRVPETLVTNDADAVARFAGRHDGVIFKRVGDGPGPAIATRALDVEALERLTVLQRCPATFQELIPAEADVRANVVGSAIVAVEIASQEGSSPLDWRFDHSVPFRPLEIPVGVARRLHALIGRLGLVTAAVDLRRTPDREYVFLEANPAGQFLFADLLAGVATYELLAGELTGIPAAEDSLGGVAREGARSMELLA